MQSTRLVSVVITTNDTGRNCFNPEPGKRGAEKHPSVYPILIMIRIVVHVGSDFRNSLPSLNDSLSPFQLGYSSSCYLD